MDGVQDEVGVGPAQQVAVLLVDGLGFHLLARAAEASPLIGDVLAGRAGSLRQLSSPFPSTTPTSLVTLGTGVESGAHGVVGFTSIVPGTDRVLTHVQWRDDPPVTAWQPVPSLFERAARAGISSAVVARAMFAGSGLTLAAYGAARFVAADRGDDVAAAMVEQLRLGTRLVYGYYPSVDTAAHGSGIASDHWLRAVASTHRLISHVVQRLPGDTVFLVTADHGGLDVPAGSRVDMSADPRLCAGVRVVAGEPRVRYLHTVDGAVEDVLATWRGVLGDRARVYSRAQAIATGWYGTVPDGHARRIGDVVVVCEGDTAVVAPGWDPPTVTALVAFHGSITAAETAIPLLRFPA
ncbi:MAG: alkaline phosphatase family protein [Jatrophihabitans sp.]|nr:MAG: alkaline phosphatase family protein [Jatrophihabitans sp.]